MLEKEVQGCAKMSRNVFVSLISIVPLFLIGVVICGCGNLCKEGERAVWKRELRARPDGKVYEENNYVCVAVSGPRPSSGSGNRNPEINKLPETKRPEQTPIPPGHKPVIPPGNKAPILLEIPTHNLNYLSGVWWSRPETYQEKKNGSQITVESVTHLRFDNNKMIISRACKYLPNNSNAVLLGKSEVRVDVTIPFEVGYTSFQIPIIPILQLKEVALAQESLKFRSSDNEQVFSFDCVVNIGVKTLFFSTYEKAQELKLYSSHDAFHSGRVIGLPYSFVRSAPTR
ncbi:MAG: hypothetical protein HY537_14280 [Deltaproteobacteria bacterium]|nr:hypothetical protein [Deltaproteobacteria bacterium]